MKKVMIELDNSIKIKFATEDRIWFDDGSYISFDHPSDCCEYNYADFSSILDTPIDGAELNHITLESNDYGFLLNGHLVNCYSEQNGYYSYDIDIFYKDEYDRTMLWLNTDCGER